MAIVKWERIYYVTRERNWNFPLSIAVFEWEMHSNEEESRNELLFQHFPFHSNRCQLSVTLKEVGYVDTSTHTHIAIFLRWTRSRFLALIFSPLILSTKHYIFFSFYFHLLYRKCMLLHIINLHFFVCCLLAWYFRVNENRVLKVAICGEKRKNQGKKYGKFRQSFWQSNVDSGINHEITLMNRWFIQSFRHFIHVLQLFCCRWWFQLLLLGRIASCDIVVISSNGI